MGLGHDRIAVADVKPGEFGIKRRVGLANQSVVIAGGDVEKPEALIDPLRILQRVLKVAGERVNGGAERPDPVEIAQVHDPGLNRLQPAHRQARNGSLPRLLADVVARLDKRNDVMEQLLVDGPLVAHLRPCGLIDPALEIDEDADRIGLRRQEPEGNARVGQHFGPVIPKGGRRRCLRGAGWCHGRSRGLSGERCYGEAEQGLAQQAKG